MSKLPILYGPDGRRLHPAIRSIAYNAAGRGRRSLNWNASSESINSIVESSAENLRNRSRDQVRKNPIASAARERYVSNIVGTGIVPIPKSQDEAFRLALKELWEQWIYESDADGLCDFYGQQALVAGALFESGEIFARLRPRRPEDGLSVPLQIQLLEADFLQNGLNEDLGGGRRIRSGIEFDAIGRRAGYHFYREHPGERYGLKGVETVRVPASEIIHVFEPLRPGQLRGLPRTASVLPLLYDLESYDDAQLMRQKIAALFAFFFTKQADPGFGVNDDAGDSRAMIDSIEPGTGYELMPGESVEFSNPPDLGNYSEFLSAQLHKVAGALDLTYEQLTGDMKGVNYSSARVALLEIRRRHEQVQHGVLAFQFCRRIWDRWISDAVISGSLQSPADFFEARRLHSRVEWMPQGWQWVDPAKEVKAAIDAINGGLTSRTRVVAETGYNVEDIDEERASDAEREDTLGLAAPAPVVQEEIPKDEDDQEDLAAIIGKQDKTINLNLKVPGSVTRSSAPKKLEVERDERGLIRGIREIIGG